MAAKLSTATIPVNAGDSKWSPTPTARHEVFKVQRSGHRHRECLFRVQRGRLEFQP